MLKLFLTGDNHIGLKYANHEQAAALISERLEAIERMVRKANEEKCGLFVIAGDLFENTYGISKKDVKAVADMLSQFNGITAVLPGNHDYYDNEAKVWHYFKDVTHDNILLLTDYRPYEITIGDDTAILYPALCTSLHSAKGENNLGWIKSMPITDSGKYHIGIAHGAVEGETIDNEGQYFLMTRDELSSIPVDVWLIGHTHVPFPNDLKTDVCTEGEHIFNAGTHVQTDVSCNTEGCGFIIEIDEDKTVRAKKASSGGIRFYRKNITLTAGNMKAVLTRELGMLDDKSVVDIILDGAVTDTEYAVHDEVLRDMLSRFTESTYNDHALSRLISDELIKSEFSETSFSSELLSALMDEPKEAQLLYELLKELKAERS